VADKVVQGEGLTDVPALVLVGGRGLRLRPVVPNLPKVLAEVKNRPFLMYLLDQIAATPIRKVVLCTGYRGDAIRHRIGDSYRGLRIFYSRENRPLGTGGALRKALTVVAADHLLVMNGDSYCGVDIGKFWEWYQKRQADVALVLARVQDGNRYGTVELGSDDRITGFSEKTGRREGWINAGVYLMKFSLLQALPEDTPFSIEYDLFPQWVTRRFFGYKNRHRFIDIGTPEAYAQADAFFTNTGRSYRS
jgi:NDP-sugar pyrophosphorylase family protein